MILPAIAAISLPMLKSILHKVEIFDTTYYQTDHNRSDENGKIETLFLTK